MRRAEEQAREVLKAVEDDDLSRAERETWLLRELLASCGPEEAERAAPFVARAQTLARANRAHLLHQLRDLARGKLYAEGAPAAATWHVEG